MSDEKPTINITSNNQSGGITAHTVNAYGDRYHSGAVIPQELLAALPVNKPIKVSPTLMDGPTHRFCEEMRAELQRRGFTVLSALETGQILGVPFLTGVLHQDEGDSYRILVGDVRV